MENENSSPDEKSWFAEYWKTALICAALSTIFGGGAGAGLVATKAVSAAPQVSGLTQDQADVRYLTKAEAEMRRDALLKEIGEVKKTMLTREVYEAFHKGDVEKMERMEKLFERFLERQNSR